MPETGSSCDRLLDELEAEAAAVYGNTAKIEELCERLRPELARRGDAAVGRLAELARAASARISRNNEPIVALVCEAAGRLSDPWRLLEGLLDSQDVEAVALALRTLDDVARRSPGLIDDLVLRGLAARAERSSGPFASRSTLEMVANLVGTTTGIADLCLHSDDAVRRLGARLLDLDGLLPSASTSGALLGESASWLSPYLAWTRATHLDLVAIATGDPARVADSLRTAERVCGEKLLREIIAAIGWPNLNFGLTAEKLCGMKLGGSFPLLMHPAEAMLLEGVEPHERAFDRILVTAYGGEGRKTQATGGDVIARFRAYNLAHAELLAGFLDLTPLTAAKVRKKVELMDRIVSDFQTLFATHTDECPTLAAVYSGLRAAIDAASAGEPGDGVGPLSAELTRLVDMFEDPHSLADVHTLHGMKRYLHQRGLKLGMQLAETGGRAGRSVTFVVAAGDRVVENARAIEYVDFEAEEASDVAPYAVRLVVEEFARQLVHAQQPLPKVKVFCYGNEVHYFVYYRNHPAFVRIDFSPPSRGGMIDLAYFGVSKYELGAHPDVSLPAVERFFRQLDFDVSIDNTHVHARYDKERAFDLADLCDKAAALFRLAPYLMDLDWVIGDLALGAASRAEVAEAWAASFAEWGVLPLRQLLTADRRGVLAGVETDPSGVREVRWNGREPYRDCFSVKAPADAWSRIREALESRELSAFVPADSGAAIAQLTLEQRLLRPLRHAIARGEVVEGENGFAPQSTDRFQRRHAAQCLAAILRSDPSTIAQAVQLAGAVAMLARGLRFQLSGAINGYDTQQASLPFPGSNAGLHVLRDGSGIFRLALFAPGDALYVSRSSNDAPWQESWSVDAASFAAALRRNNYPTPWTSPPAVDAAGVAASVLEAFRSENPHAALPPLPDEHALPGVAASPGRATGTARLGLTGRRPADVDNGIVISPAMTPADGAFLVSSAGVVSTGGGALSHAGLLALQYGKPALIVRGTWEHAGDNVSAFRYRMTHYDEVTTDCDGWRVTERCNFRQHEELLREGDLVVVDADENVLRVLGSDRDALLFHELLAQLAFAARRLSATDSDSEMLAERGRRLRARHQLEKVLGRIADPVLARHAASELLLRDTGVAADKELLIGVLLANPAVGEEARRAVRATVDTLVRRLAGERDEAMQLIPTSRWGWEVLSLRLDALRFENLVSSVSQVVTSEGFDAQLAGRGAATLDAIAASRLETLRDELMSAVEDAPVARLRHVVDELDRLDRVLGSVDSHRAAAARAHHRITISDRAVQRESGGRRILDASAGGIELRHLAGNKAANLAQIAQLGEGALVPPWFVITDRAFREVFASPTGTAEPKPTVAEAVEKVVARADLDNVQKSSGIRQIWEAAELPDVLVDGILAAYAKLASATGEEQPFVAVRSSAAEEDLEAVARAGEFDTFLFVRGSDALLTHVKRAWSGLWSERALHHRGVFGDSGQIGGGVLVQKMIASASSGVLHTVNVAERRSREMVINAGLGLGEGVVSGAVAADRIIVSKDAGLEQGELHFRYLAAEKRERVVFNSRLGSGTARVETLYHQRLRPALEYVDLCELVRSAARLEAAYGYPLDIEFAIEGTSLYILQVRPIPTPLNVWRDTVERWPLKVH